MPLDSLDLDEMPHNVAFHQGLNCLQVKKIFRQENTMLFLNYNLTPIDVYNGLSQVNCIKPEGITHKYIKD